MPPFSLRLRQLDLTIGKNVLSHRKHESCEVRSRHAEMIEV